MKKYKVGISELGYEEIVDAEDEQEAEEMALIHCKQYFQEYVDVDTLEEVKWIIKKIITILDWLYYITMSGVKKKVEIQVGILNI